MAQAPMSPPRIDLSEPLPTPELLEWLITLCDREIARSRGARRKRWESTRVKLTKQKTRLKKKSPEPG